MNKNSLINEIEKGIKSANDYFVKNNIKAKAYSPVNVLLGREYILVKDGIYAETLDELLDKLAWCDSVGLNQNPMRLQPITFSHIMSIIRGMER